MALVSSWELGAAREIESSFDLPRLGFKESQVYTNGVPNDLSHVFVADNLTDLSKSLSVGFGQPNGGRLQLLLDGTGCIQVSPLPKGSYAGCIPLLPNLVDSRKLGVAL